MKKIAWGSSFRRAFKRRIRKTPALHEKILEAIAQLAQDPAAPGLKSHKLHGQLEGLWACWVEYDCRIIFTFEPDPESTEEMVVLIDIGTHDEVY